MILIANTKEPFVRDSEPETDETEPDQDSGSDVSLPPARKHGRATSRPSFLVANVDADVELTYTPYENDTIKVTCFMLFFFQTVLWSFDNP